MRSLLWSVFSGFCCKCGYKIYSTFRIWVFDRLNADHLKVGIPQETFEFRDLIVSVINLPRTLIPSAAEVSLTHKYIEDPAWLRHTMCIPESLYRIIQVMVNRMAKNHIYRIIRKRQRCRIKLL